MSEEPNDIRPVSHQFWLTQLSVSPELRVEGGNEKL